MAGTVASMLAALSSAGIMGWGDQYLVLLVAGLLARSGAIHPAGAAAFISGWPFLLAVSLAWAITTLPSLLPHNAFLAAAVNALSGPVTLLSGGLFALVSAGVIAGVQPELASSLYLVSRNSHLLALSAYRPGDVALLGGGATVASGLTAVKFVAKPGIALKTGTMGHLAALMFALLGGAAALGLTPAVLSAAANHPLLLLAVMGLLIGGLIALFLRSLRWLRNARQGFGRFLALLDERPRDGVRVLIDALLPGTGWLLAGFLARGLLTLTASVLLFLLALSLIGSLLAIPLYLLLARASAVSLFRRLSPQPAAVPL